jgi:hypothetical protein
MTNILSSASKIVFIMIAGAVIAAMFTGKISGEQFMALATMTFAFYFGSKVNGGNDMTTPTATV